MKAAEAAWRLDHHMATLDVRPPPDGWTVVGRYFELLLKWNDAAGLVAPGPPATLLVRHVVDGLALLRLLPHEGTLVDVGSGGGLPGLVVGLSSPGRLVTLVEPNERKCAFLREAISILGVEDTVRVHPERVESLGAVASDLAVSRATFPPAEWVVRARALLGPGGAVVVMLGRADRTPVVASAREAGYTLEGEDRFDLPEEAGFRQNLLFRRLR
jgi:16S rRNA (guanine527-N7)-methyltransferase